MNLLVSRPELDRVSMGGRPPVSPEELIRIREYSPEVMAALHTNLPSLARFEDRVVLRTRAGVDLTAEVYTPHGVGLFPVHIYLHGGGWCLDSAAVARRPAMRIAAQGFVVINLEYGLAPEHPFPWALEDVVYAIRWAATHGEAYSGDGARISVGGDSAGANLSAAAAVVLHGGSDEIDGGDLGDIQPRIRRLLLMYGGYDAPRTFFSANAPSGYREQWLLGYLGPHFLKYLHHPLVSPMLSPRLGTFPPTYLSVGDGDWLVASAAAMATALAEAHVPTTLSVVAGLDHGFNYLDPLPAAAEEELNRVYRWLADTHDG